MLDMSEKGSEVVFNILSLTNPDLNLTEFSRLVSLVQLYENAGSKSRRVRGLDQLMETLSESDESIDLFYISKVVALIKRYEESTLEAQSLDTFIKVVSLVRKNLDLTYLKRIIEVTESPEDRDLIEDSLSLNQFKSKRPLLDAIESLGILNPDSVVVIWGCWYGSILIPYLQNRVASIVGIDIDDDVVRVAKNRFFYDASNVELITDDIFATHRKIYLNTDLIINTSCEHMAPMKEWHWFKHGAMKTDTGPARGETAVQSEGKKVFATPKLSSGCHFAFQSNDMFDIEGHTNCVRSLAEFKSQLPARAEVLLEDEIQDDRGTRFMLVGKLN